MIRRMMLLLALLAVAGLHPDPGQAQPLNENHYLIYDTFYSNFIDWDVELHDQFYNLFTPHLEFDMFANPVMKNDEPYFDYGAHQAWYRFDMVLEDIWQVDLMNQFGPQRWYVKDAHYLVLPAEKLMAGTPPPQYEHNHFTCYEVVQAPWLDIPVFLHDQFGEFDTNVVRPVYFCNPCEKWVFGAVYPIVDPDVHLAVYELQPGFQTGIGVTSLDQFESWTFMVEEAIWLAVPSWKYEAVANETSTWGDVKAMYR